MEYCESFTEYTAIEEYYQTQIEAEFRSEQLNVDGKWCRIHITEQPCYYDADEKTYFPLAEQSVTVLSLTTAPGFSDFKAKQEHKKALLQEQSELRERALSKLTSQERQLLNL